MKGKQLFASFVKTINLDCFREGHGKMYYKMIVYKQKYVNIETKNGIKARVYFQKIATKHNIHKTMLTKEQLQLYQNYKKLYDGWQLTIDTMLETEDETQTLIYKNNAKIRGLT